MNKDKLHTLEGLIPHKIKWRSGNSTVSMSVFLMAGN